MFEMMSKCCPGGGGLSDRHSMMNMMLEKCCGPKSKNTEADSNRAGKSAICNGSV